MDAQSIVNILVPIAGIAVLIALVFLLIEVIKLVKIARVKVVDMTDRLSPTLDHVEVMTKDLVPVVAKVDPLTDRVMLTIDSVNLEMMRVDTILENVAEITDSASNATSAVENLTNVPVKAVNNVAFKVKTKLGGRTASDESTQIADQREAVARALQDYKAAEAKEAKHAATAPAAPAPEAAAAAAAGACSSIVFHAPHSGHLPIHLGDSYPHAAHTYSVLSFAICRLFHQDCFILSQLGRIEKRTGPF